MNPTNAQIQAASQMAQAYKRYIRQEWDKFGALAYSGFSQAGPGVIVLDLIGRTEAADVYYITPAKTRLIMPWSAPLLNMAQTYNPLNAAVFAVLVGNRERAQMLHFSISDAESPRAVFERSSVAVKVFEAPDSVAASGLPVAAA